MMSLRLFLLLPAVSALRVTVAGGSGFVGSRVCKYLVENGAEVTSVSKSGKAPAGAGSWASSVKWVANDFTRGSMGELEAALGTPEAFVSCVGTVGFDRQGLVLGNGKANVDCAKALTNIGGVQRCSYVSVSGELFDSSGWLPGFFVGYFDGKKMAESALKDLAPTTIVRPTFIYGGDEFAIAPPRVTAEYGEFIEGLLSAGPFQFLAGVLPGLLKVALRPPVSVDAVAACCARTALGSVEAGQEIEGTEAINGAADLPPKPEAAAAF